VGSAPSGVGICGAAGGATGQFARMSSGKLQTALRAFRVLTEMIGENNATISQLRASRLWLPFLYP